MDERQQNNKCRLCGDRNESFNHIKQDTSTYLDGEGDPLGIAQKI